MATTYPTEPGPFGVQGQQPGTGLWPREPEVANREVGHMERSTPSNAHLWAALGAVGVSLLLRRNTGRFLGPLLLYGLYNKLVKGR